MTRKLTEEYEKWGLEVNTDNTKYMSVGDNQNHHLRLEGGRHIEHCQDYQYLGVKLDKAGTLDKAIKERNTKEENYFLVEWSAAG